MTRQKSLFESFRDAQPGMTPDASELQKESMLERAIEGKSDLAAKLEGVTEKAIEKTDEILDLTLPSSDHPAFGAVLRAQNAAANTVLNTQVKVDENSLRRQTVDRLPELLEILREEQLKLAIRRAGNG
jgi:hypothetical protein